MPSVSRQHELRMQWLARSKPTNNASVRTTWFRNAENTRKIIVIPDRGSCTLDELNPGQIGEKRLAQKLQPLPHYRGIRLQLYGRGASFCFLDAWYDRGAPHFF